MTTIKKLTLIERTYTYTYVYNDISNRTYDLIHSTNNYFELDRGINILIYQIK